MKMNKLNLKKLLFFMLVLLITGCKETYDSPVPSVETGYLVVEGVINNDGDTTAIKLSRTTSLADRVKRVEKGAVVTIEGTNASSFTLVETLSGNYTINNIHLDTSVQYRIKIQTANNEQFQSDFVSVRNNPPIDSINWAQENDGLQLFINTHNPQANSRYYQWEFNETWEFHTRYAILKYVEQPQLHVDYRNGNDPQIYQCWQFDASNEILIGSSAKLSEDIIHLPLTFIPSASIKLSVLYSILVKQYAWSKEGYEFLERMKKNTETVGSIFDPQPSELNSNIHCVTDPRQPVIGFFNICTITEKRIFINNYELPGWNYRDNCELTLTKNHPDSIMRGTLPTEPVETSAFGIISFYASSAPCVDCRLTGTDIKPDYWP